MSFRIRVAPPPSGMYLRPCVMPIGTPDVLVSTAERSPYPRAAWRSLLEMPEGRFGVLEGWGESDVRDEPAADDPAARILTMAAASEDIHDIEPVSHPLFDLQTVRDHLSRATVDGNHLEWGHGVRHAGHYFESGALTDHIRVDLEVFSLWRAPYLVLQVCATRRSVGDPAATCVLRIPGFDEVTIRVGVVGQTTDMVVILTRTDQPVSDAFSLQAMAEQNRYETSSAALHEDTTYFCGAPVGRIWNAPTALVLSRNVTPRMDPDNPGADGSYGLTCASVIWSKTGAVLGSVAGLLVAAAAYCDRQDGWILASGEEVDPWPARPNLTFDEGYPWKGLSWQNDANDPRDTLGYPIERDSNWPPTASGRLPADAEHVTGAPLAAAAMLTGRLGLRILCRRQGVMLSYERAFAVTLAPNSRSDWTPSGRHCARPMKTIAAHASVDRRVRYEVADRVVSRKWLPHVRRKQESHGLPKSCPCVIGAIPSGGIVTPYEEVMIAEAALAIYRITRSLDALVVARVQGRYAASKCMLIQQPGQTVGSWHAFYQAPWKADGALTFVGEPGTAIADQWLNRWMGALVSYVAACMGLAAGGNQDQLDDTDGFWLQVASRAIAAFSVPLNETQPNEMNAWANQALPGISPSAFVVAVAPVS